LSKVKDFSEKVEAALLKLYESKIPQRTSAGALLLGRIEGKGKHTLKWRSRRGSKHSHRRHSPGAQLGVHGSMIAKLPVNDKALFDDISPAVRRDAPICPAK